MITGDAMHHPCQLAHPDWSPPFDVDRTASEATRRQLLEDVADQPVLVIGTHFAAPTAGHVKRDGAASPSICWAAPGFTAYGGLLTSAGLKDGEQGFRLHRRRLSQFGQPRRSPKIQGMRRGRLDGLERKARWLKDECGLDAVINYKT